MHLVGMFVSGTRGKCRCAYTTSARVSSSGRICIAVVVIIIIVVVGVVVVVVVNISWR